MSNPLERLRHHVTGAIERGEAAAIVGQPANLHTARTESSPVYLTAAPADTSDDAIIAAALTILERRLRDPGAKFDSPKAVRDYCTIALADRDHEVFGVLFLDAQHRLIEWQAMFRGSLTQTSVYPREVVKVALALNAAAVILTHNHPSGEPEPSRADELLTHALKNALALIDVRILDHIIVGGVRTTSLAERGLI